MSNRRVTLLGGTGFVGTQLTYRLAALFDEVVVLTRHSQRVQGVRILANVDVRQLDVHSSDELEAGLAGSAVVINLIGILNQSGKFAGNSFAGAHSDLTANIISTCQKLQIRRYLHMSALNADAENGSSEYLRSKGLAEQHVRNCDPQLHWTIFQPSVIFGEQDAFLNLFANLLSLMPVFPLACPDARMAPVYVGDVCQAMVDSLEVTAPTSNTVQLCGPTDYSLRELVEFCAESAGLRRTIVGLPDWAARLQARVMEWVPGKPFSRDNYLSLQTDSVCGSGCTRQPTSLQAIAPHYLGSSDINSRYQTYRRFARR